MTTKEIAFAYEVLKFIGKLILLWPIDDNKNWFYHIFHELCSGLLMAVEILLFCGVAVGFYNFYDEIPTFSTIIFILIELTALCEIMFVSIIFKVQKLSIKTLISVIEITVYNVNSKEEILFKEYVNSSNLMIVICAMIFSFMTVVYAYMQLFEPMLILPKEVWHPFPINPLIKKYLVLIQQLIYIIHLGGISITDGLVIVSLKIATVRLQVLAENFQSVTNELELKKCIRKHQKILTFVNNINNTMRFKVLLCVLTTAFYLICGFLQLVHKHEKLNGLLIYQFTGATIIAMYRLYCIANSANDLAMKSENLQLKMPWEGKSREISKSMFIVIQRSQKPLGITVSGIMPHLDLNYYGKFLYMTFSYFVAVKAILEY